VCLHRCIFFSFFNMLLYTILFFPYFLGPKLPLCVCVYCSHLCRCSIYKYINVCACVCVLFIRSSRKEQLHSHIVNCVIHTFFLSFIFFLSLSFFGFFLSLFSVYTHKKKSAAKIMNENYSF